MSVSSLVFQCKWRPYEKYVSNHLRANTDGGGAVADLRGARGTHAPLQVQILSISCSFWENLAKSYVGAPLGSWHPLLGEILDPPLGAVVFSDGFGNSQMGRGKEGCTNLLFLPFVPRKLHEIEKKLNRRGGGT